MVVVVGEGFESVVFGAGRVDDFTGCFDEALPTGVVLDLMVVAAVFSAAGLVGAGFCVCLAEGVGFFSGDLVTGVLADGVFDGVAFPGVGREGVDFPAVSALLGILAVFAGDLAT